MNNHRCKVNKQVNIEEAAAKRNKQRNISLEKTSMK